MKPLHKTILHVIKALDGDGYGVTIRQAVEQRTGKSISIGALYVALDELEEQGFVTSRQEKGGAERGFREKRCYWLTGHGLAEAKV
jgi:PadR family transcriptional regulator PadR